jgi:hypothetical protein
MAGVQCRTMPYNAVKWSSELEFRRSKRKISIHFTVTSPIFQNLILQICFETETVRNYNPRRRDDDGVVGIIILGHDIYLMVTSCFEC